MAAIETKAQKLDRILIDMNEIIGHHSKREGYMIWCLRYHLPELLEILGSDGSIEDNQGYPITQNKFELMRDTLSKIVTKDISGVNEIRLEASKALEEVRRV